MKGIYETKLEGLKLLKRGKVRDIYDLDEHLLIVATDRLSAFDCVFPDPIPMKGAVLTQISRFWFDKTKDIIPNHIVSFEPVDYLSSAKKHAEILRGRSMLVKKSRPLPVECVARGYLHGSSWKEYREQGSISGIALPSGMRQKDVLPEPIFTPATKAESGHDENITYDKAAEILGRELAEFVKTASLKLYRFAHSHLIKQGIILVDTKFEFGIYKDEPILIDECITPDSSRIYEAKSYMPDMESVNYDKQYVRDYLESTDWDKTPPAPPLPQEIIQGTTRRYLEAYKIMTGKELKI
ncbi:phosphoribosylaminoimidazolesuccinocarboxamide synthase [Candidatus Sumerlaeota bacterium]|nr:phosphoribosylaminoimidazolesuccinocarboxamide synthase [Candidatus Sumerlaeota bacterium]